MSRRARSVACALAAVFFLSTGLLNASPASAHPLGNFTVNQSSALTVRPDLVTIALVVDMAEIPAFQERQRIDRNHDSTVEDTERDAYGVAECSRIAGKVRLAVDGAAVPVTSGPARLAFPAGAAGLTTLRLECALRAALPAGLPSRSIVYEDSNFPGRIGWREITATGDGTRLIASDVPATSPSAFLTRYPSSLLQSPLDVRSAHVRFAVGGPGATAPRSGSGTAGLLPRGIDRFTQSFTSLVSRRHFTLPFVLLAIILAIALGAVHALAPGHGKTIVAAYLVGQRGSFRQSALIGAAVTVTHTAGVLALGIALSVSQAIAPERLYPILGLASGLLLASIGVGLLRRAVRARAAGVRRLALGEPAGGHVHEGAPMEGNDEAGALMEHDHGGRAHRHVPPSPDAPLRWRSLAAMGFAGGLVPSPSALVVLLGAIALGRAWFGVILVLAYGAGMAGVLIAAGLLLVRARAILDRRAGTRRNGSLARLARFVPVGTASIIVGVGALLAVRGVTAIR